MLLTLWLALAGADELSCEMRGLPVRIVYEASGLVTMYDGEEVLAQAQAEPFPTKDVRASCSGDRFRLVRGGNQSADGSHATLSVDTMELDLGPVLDTLPPERFDPRLAALRRAKRAAGEAAWTELDQALKGLAPLHADERDAVVDALLREGSKAAVARAWSLVEPGESRLRKEAGLTLLRMHAEAGDLDAVVTIATALPGVDLACEWLGRVDWMAGKKGKARKQWASCGVLSEEAQDWCDGCQVD